MASAVPLARLASDALASLASFASLRLEPRGFDAFGGSLASADDAPGPPSAPCA